MEVFLTINRKFTQSCNWINVGSFQIIFPWKWRETVAFSLCHSLLLILFFCCSFSPVPFLCTGMAYPWATFPSGLYLLCCGAPPVALTLFSLPLCLHYRHLLLHFFNFLFFFFLSQRHHTHCWWSPKEEAFVLLNLRDIRKSPSCLLYLETQNTNQQWLSLGINSLMWNWIHQQEKTVRRKKTIIQIYNVKDHTS